MGIVFILLRKQWGVTLEILKRGYLKLWKLCQKRGSLIENVLKIE